MVEYLTKQPAADTAGGGQSVVYLDFPTTYTLPSNDLDPSIFQQEKSFLQQIRTYLSHNTAVVVKGWQPQFEMGFSISDFERRNRHLDQIVQAQSVFFSFLCR